VVLLDHSPHPSIPSLRVDDLGGGHLATKHLLDLGHRRIAHFTWDDVPLEGEEQDAGNARFRGYRQALSEAGVQFDPSWVISCPRNAAGGQELAKRFLMAHSEPSARPTAVFATNDLIAFGSLRGFHEAGVRVPNDVALVGFHGVELSKLTIPALTTVELHPAELGRRGAEMLFSLLDGKPLADLEQVLPVSLVVRESSGQPRA
jgi:DNA-binding LacI/PurR family transcriptional regulator